MNATRKIAVACLLQGCAIGLPMFLAATSGAHAAEPKPCVTTYRTSLDARLAAKADDGVDALRQFVTRTRTIHQLDMQEAIARVETHRADRKACEQAAALDDAPEMFRE